MRSFLSTLAKLQLSSFFFSSILFLSDKTGKISLTNLKQVSRLCGVKLNEQELKEMIQEADKDGDSEVDQEEFVNIMLKTNLFSS